MKKNWFGLIPIPVLYTTYVSIYKALMKEVTVCKSNKFCSFQARQELIKDTCNRNIFGMQLDLASLKSIKDFADKYVHITFFILDRIY